MTHNISLKVITIGFIVVLSVAFGASWLDTHRLHAETSKPLNLAAIFALTSQAAASNRSSVLGTRLAIDEINRGGGVLGRNFNLILLDNMSTPIGSSLAAKQAVDSNVAGIIGAQWSSHSLAIARIAQQNKIPMISNYSTHPKLTAIGEFIFRVCYTDNLQGKVMAEFAHRELNAKTALVIVDLTSDYSLALSSIFRNHFESLGGTVAGEIEYKAKKLNYDQLIRRILTTPADVVFLSGHEESGTIAHRLQKSNYKAIPLGGDGWADEIFLRKGGRYLKRGYFCTHWAAAADREASMHFFSKYHGRDDFGPGGALAYDAVMVLAKAIEKAGSAHGEQVIRALSEMETYEGVTGSIKFDGQGDPVKSVVIMNIQDGIPYYLKTLSPQ